MTYWTLTFPPLHPLFQKTKREGVKEADHVSPAHCMSPVDSDLTSRLHIHTSFHLQAVPAPSNATTTWWDDVVIQEPSKNEESSYQGNPFHEPNAALARPSLSQPTTSSQGAQGKFYRGNGGRRGSDFLSYSTYFIPLSLIFSTSFTSIPG